MEPSPTNVSGASPVAVTVARQAGSYGEEVARRVAEKLGVPLYDREVLALAAAQAGVSPETLEQSEHATPILERMLESLGRVAALEELGALPAPGLSFLTNKDYRRLIAEVLQRLAAQGGAVVLGHAGQVLLKDVHGVLKVLVTAPATLRAARLMVQGGLSEESAQARLADLDNDRTKFFHSVYQVDFLDVHLYDLCINTAALSVDAAVAAVVEAAAGLRRPEALAADLEGGVRQPA